MAPIRVGISHYLTPKLRPKDRWHSRKSIPPTAGPSEPGGGGNYLSRFWQIWKQNINTHKIFYFYIFSNVPAKAL